MEGWAKVILKIIRDFIIIFALMFTLMCFAIDPILDAIEENLKRYEWRFDK